MNIINKKENHINNLKQNFLKNAKIPENIMRNNYSNQMRINNSVGNDKKENSENIINILNKELNKKYNNKKPKTKLTKTISGL